MFRAIPSSATAHAGLPPGPGLKISSVEFRALVLDARLDHGDDVTPEELERNAAALDAGAQYIDALLTLVQNGTRDQCVRHLTWLRDRLSAEAHNRQQEAKEQLATTN